INLIFRAKTLGSTAELRSSSPEPWSGAMRCALVLRVAATTRLRLYSSCCQSCNGLDMFTFLCLISKGIAMWEATSCKSCDAATGTWQAGSGRRQVNGGRGSELEDVDV